MFLNNAIYQYINKYLDTALIKKGTEIFRNRFVSRPEHDKANKIVSAIVKDINKVSVYYENPFTIKKIYCNCKLDHICEHIPAALYYLLSINDNLLTETSLNPQQKPSGGQRNVKGKIIPLKAEKPHPQQYLKEGPPNTFRKLPASSPAELNRILPHIKPTTGSYYYNAGYRFLITLNPTDELVFSLVNLYDYNFRRATIDDILESKEFVKVLFKKQDKDILFRCSACSGTRAKLCEHQYAVLYEKINSEIIFSDAWKDRKALVAKFSSQLKLKPEKFEKLYKIVFENISPSCALTAKNYLNYDALKKQKEITSRFFQVGRNETDILAEHLKIKSKSLKANALLWPEYCHEEDLPLLLEGTTPKGGGKLTAHIEAVNSPLYLNEEEEEMYRAMLSLQNEYGKQPNGGFPKYFLNFLKQHIHLLQGMIHYTVPQINFDERIVKKDLEQFRFSGEYADLLFDTEEDDDFYTMRIYARFGDNQIEYNMRDFTVCPYFVVNDGVAYLYKSYEAALYYNGDNDESYFFTDKEEPAPLIEVLNEFARFFEVNYPSFVIPEIRKIEHPSKALYLKEGGNFIILEPRFILEDGQFFVLPAQGRMLSQNSDDLNPVFIEFDDEQADQFVKFLKAQHPAFEETYDKSRSFYIEVKELIKHAWFLQFFAACKEANISVFGQEQLTNFRFNTNTAKVAMNISSGIDWFDVKVDISFGDQKVQLKQWVESVRNNERYVLLDDGSLGLIPDEWYEKLKQVALASDEEKGKLKISKYRFGIIDSMFEELSDVKMMKEIKSKMKQLQHYEFKKTYPVPAEVKADLREYQVLGFQWLKALNDLGFGGCLADDMGLGKTVQVLSLLADQQKQGKGTSLAIVPRSLLFNWAAEIDKFCPSLQYIHYHGPDRMLKREVLKDYDLVITTYDTATNDVEFFKDIHFNYIILDESQAIKNPASKRYKAMRLLNADNRIVMTGTPIENNTFDLYAQFSFINPGIFGSQQYFRDRFAIPIDKEQDSETAQLLKKMINPFLMRRTKEQVATDLPERVENIIYCEMDSVQRSFYDSLKNTIKSEIESAVFSKGFDKARFKIIEGLLRLRQVCNAPQLVDPSLPVHKRSSVKIETLLDIIENDLGNHNALIFSQFTSMLDIVRAQLDKKEIKYAYLDGSTKDRKGAVEYFEQNEDVKLFLLSLKAGNTGLNLTKADYVYLIDPWWNPAVEAQAIDRTHRIGQTKNVFAYKMICKNTIEEKIVELQSKKKKLASELVVTDENVFKSLDKEEIIALFD